MKKLVVKFFFVIMGIILLAGCAPRMAIKPGYDFSRIERLAVLNFEGEQGAAVADEFMLQLLKAGFDVMERTRIENILKEQDLGVSGRIDSSTVKRIGKILGVDAVISGSIIQFEAAKRHIVYFKEERPTLSDEIYVVERGDNYIVYLTDAKVGISARLIDVETGTIAWIATQSFKAFTTDGALYSVASSLVQSLRSTIKK